MAVHVAHRWITCPFPRPEAPMRLFCFPYAGAGASVYHSWGRDLPSWVECAAVKLPGREDRIRETSATDVRQLIGPLTEELRPMLDRPFAFYGHSMGAHIAHELTLALRRAGGPMPSALFLGAYPAPGQ